MSLIPVLVAWWALVAFVAWAWCRSAGQADERIERMRETGGWRN